MEAEEGGAVVLALIKMLTEDPTCAFGLAVVVDGAEGVDGVGGLGGVLEGSVLIILNTKSLDQV